jgi:hypothetical protein
MKKGKEKKRKEKGLETLCKTTNISRSQVPTKRPTNLNELTHYKCT